MPNDLLKFFSSIDHSMLLIILAAVYVVSYIIIALLNSNIIKPLLYLGIPTLVGGIFILIVRFASGFIINLMKNELSSFIVKLIPSALKPLLITGIVFAVLGLVMIVIYKIVKKQTIEI